MKKIHFAFIICFFLILYSCNKKEEILKAEVKIEGMTCELGCANLIESKINKLEGVKSSEVSFEKKIGQFTFDSNQTSLQEIEKTINGIAGGKLYKVIDSKIVKVLFPIDNLKK